MGGVITFENLLTPALLKTCPNCGGSGRMFLAPWISCEPCDGSGMVPNQDGRQFLDVLDPGRFRIVPQVELER